LQPTPTVCCSSATQLEHFLWPFYSGVIRGAHFRLTFLFRPVCCSSVPQPEHFVAIFTHRGTYFRLTICSTFLISLQLRCSPHLSDNVSIPVSFSLMVRLNASNFSPLSPLAFVDEKWLGSQI
jgi:hypothetical protein